MYCHECGDEVPESAGICPSCGATLTVGSEAENEPSERTTPNEPDQQGRPENQPPTGQNKSPGTDTGPETDDESESQQPSDPAGGMQQSPGTTDRGESKGPDGQPSRSGPRQQPGQPGQSGPSPQGTGTQPTQGQPTDTQPPQGSGPQQGQGYPQQSGQPPQDGQPRQGSQPPQGQGGQPPQGGQRQSPAQPVQGRPGGQGGGPGQPAPAGGPGGGYGGGFDLDRLRTVLPLLSGGIAGAVVGAVMFALGIGIAVLMPEGLVDNLLEIGAVTTMDLHFATPDHIVPYLYATFDTFQAGEAAFGFLYLLAPLLLYQTAKLITDSNLYENASLTDGVLTGATVTLGYLPVMLIAAVLVPTTSSSEFSMMTAIVLAGLIYPLLFGGLGGFVSWYFGPSERKAGTSYGTLAFFGVLIGLFATSYVYMDVSELVEVSTLDRLLASFVVFAQVHGLSIGEGVSTAAIPYLVTALIVGLVGFVRVRRSNYVRSLTDAFAKGTTPAIAYLTLFGLFTSLTVVATSGFVIDELELGQIFYVFAQAFNQNAVAGIGEYANLMLVGTIVYPVVVGGAGGALAWWLETRNRAPAPQQQAPRNPRQ
ncbi:zinc-ribbon domain-containing protein [Halorhabdus salina]|uniref:zinc-ribbon domain-containing protein n=1 Tax=Halorhabdus salina TaxID=2750670 RepID=UPI0015EFCA54|nr:hypothetical protein [Halorhabdus salina]